MRPVFKLGGGSIIYSEYMYMYVYSMYVYIFHIGYSIFYMFNTPSMVNFKSEPTVVHSIGALLNIPISDTFS